MKRQNMRSRTHRASRPIQKVPQPAPAAQIGNQDVVTPDSFPPISSPLRTQSILNMQRRYGNAAVQRMLNQDVQRAAGGKTADPAQPEQTAVDITGGYEALEPGGNNRITLQINQAGSHFRGWYQRREYSSAYDHATMIQHRLSGDLIEQTPNSVTFSYTRTDSTGREISSGRFTVNQPATAGGKPIMTMSSGEWSHRFEKLHSHSRVPTDALSHIPENVRKELVSSVEAPLDRDEETRLNAYCEQLQGQIRDYLSESRMMRMAISTKINQFVREMLGTFAVQQRPLVVRRIRERLTTSSHKVEKVTRPYWDWLQVIVIEQPSYTAAIQSGLHMSPTGASEQRNKYRFMISTVGVSGDVLVGGGVMVGTMIIEKLEPDRWTQAYALGYAGFSAGLSAGVTVGQTTNWSEFETPFPWAPANFKGWFTLSGTAVSGSYAVGGGNSPAAILLYYGDGSFEPLGVDASGWMLEYGLHAGAEAGVNLGYIGGGKEEVIAKVKPPKSIQQDIAYKTGVDVHFQVDDPSLSDTGRSAIREMCAHHLKSFENEKSVLEISGYTSTTGSEKRNQTLSDLRAQNALQGIKDAVGSRFKIPQSNLKAIGYGEKPARDAGVPDNTEDPKWRRVEVRLNGNVVLVLH